MREHNKVSDKIIINYIKSAYNLIAVIISTGEVKVISIKDTGIRIYYSDNYSWDNLKESIDAYIDSYKMSLKVGDLL